MHQKRFMSLMDIMGNQLGNPKKPVVKEGLRSNIDQYWVNTKDITADLLIFAQQAMNAGGLDLLGDIQVAIERALIQIKRMNNI